jgi:hypothetical protein
METTIKPDFLKLAENKLNDPTAPFEHVSVLAQLAIAQELRQMNRALKVMLNHENNY